MSANNFGTAVINMIYVMEHVDGKVSNLKKINVINSLEHAWVIDAINFDNGEWLLILSMIAKLVRLPCIDPYKLKDMKISIDYKISIATVSRKKIK